MATQWVLDHIGERLTFTTSGTAAGKNYGGKLSVTRVVTTETLGNLFAVQCTGRRDQRAAPGPAVQHDQHQLITASRSEVSE